MDFAGALALLKSGAKVTREAWESGVYIRLHPILADEECTLPYIVYDTNNAENTSEGLGIVPWQAGHSDLLADDWKAAESQ